MKDGDVICSIFSIVLMIVMLVLIGLSPVLAAWLARLS